MAAEAGIADCPTEAGISALNLHTCPVANTSRHLKRLRVLPALGLALTPPYAFQQLGIQAISSNEELTLAVR
ncbi:Hypothetical protein PSEBR_m1208 [Pseudomonas brassicacearum subsp. brassicacearum NFM421]|uniref:Uncharacterized protein n=1 Tax=Pseudomonas brassicacearum (strain NFM421) TaxID=994484 RepID=F2KJK5_PSEBN|nr:Hypothetical protein PSEBR_m1208 [Pseudomonas brassicacearum subsp. brassicacearum NFM421]